MSSEWTAVGFVAAAVPVLVLFLVRAQVLAGVAAAALLAAATFTDVRALACRRFGVAVQARVPPVGTSTLTPGAADPGLALATLLLVLLPAVATAAGVWFTFWHGHS